MRNGWISSLLVGLVVYAALKLLPDKILGHDHAIAAAVIAFIAAIIVRRLPIR